MYLSDFEVGGKHGFKDDYKIVIPAQFEATGSFRDGLAIVMLNRKFGVINTNGDFVIPNIYDDLIHLFGGYYAARTNFENDDWNCGVIDYNNAVVVPFDYKCIHSKDDKYFLCYKTAQSKTEGVKHLSIQSRYSYTKQSECNWFNLDGTFLTELEVVNNNKNYLIVKTESDKYGAIQSNGKLAIKPIYDTLEYCTDNVFLSTNERDGLITSSIVDNEGNVVFSTLSDFVFKDGFFTVNTSEQNEQWISIDGNVTYIGHATPLTSNYLKVYKNKKCGVLDKNGDKVINFIYDDIVFCKTFFVVRRENCIGLVGLKGEIIIDAVYKKLECVSIENNPLFLGSEQNLGWIRWNNTVYKGYCKEYCFDTAGHTNYNGTPCDYLCRSVITLNQRYNNRFNETEYIISASESFDLTKPIILHTEEYCELFTTADGIIQNSRFDEIQQITQLCYVVKKNDKYGVFRIDESTITIPVEHDQIQFFGGHTVLLRKDNMWGAKSLVLEKNIFHIFTKVYIPFENFEIKILDDSQFHFGVRKVYINYSGDEMPYYTIVDTNGKEVNNLHELYLEDNFERFDENHYLTKSNGKYGFVSSLGYVSIPFIYDEILKRKTGSFNVRIGNAWGVIDLSGKELVRVKYAQPIPLYIAAPTNTFLDYDSLKDDIAKNVRRYNDLIIVRDSLSECYGCIDINGNEAIPTIYEHLIFDYSNHLYRTEFNSDYLFFGYGGYKDEDMGTLLSGNIVSANWGCITKSGKEIIPPKYDYFKVIGDYICAGRDGGFAVSGQWGNNIHQTDYAGVYDLYTSDGEFIIGGFNKFFVDEDMLFFHFGGSWKEESDEYDYISSYFVEGNGRWLILDANLQSLIRLKDGSIKKFEKGYKLTITTKKENNKVTNYWNAPLEIFSILEPRLSHGLIVIGDGTSEKVLNPKNGSVGPNYQHITILSESFYAGINDGLIEIQNINGQALDTRYLVITEPSSEYSFAVEPIDDKYSRVYLLKFLPDNIISEVVIAKTETTKLLENIQYGFLRSYITFENGKECFSVFRPEIFDDDFRHRTIESHNLFQKKHENVYWIGTDYRLDKDYGCSYEPDDYDDHDYMRDSWDAMTDGMYGDMPDGFDGDFDFLGR